MVLRLTRCGISRVLGGDFLWFFVVGSSQNRPAINLSTICGGRGIDLEALRIPPFGSPSVSSVSASPSSTLFAASAAAVVSSVPALPSSLPPSPGFPLSAPPDSQACRSTQMATIFSPNGLVGAVVTEGGGGGGVCTSRVLDQCGKTSRVVPSAGLCARSSSAASAASASRSCSFTAAVVGAGTRRILGNSKQQQQKRRALPRESAAVVVVCNAAEAKGKPRRPKYIPNRIDDPNYVRIFDTTLRDGEQSPGASLTSKEKLDIARQLAKLGVDIIEAGYPRSSPDDLEAVKIIAKEVGNAVDDDGYVPVICGLSRCNKTDIDYAWEGVKQALRPRIHTFIATSELHMKHKLRKTPDEVVQTARDSVAYARSLGCDDVEFSPEDAGRSDPQFLYRILGEVIEAGATTLNIPDTVGFTLPTEFGELIVKLKAHTPGAENVIFSTHCQNDLGLSTANSLAGAYAGARQVECTINGIGERAGNASLEEVVMAIKCRGEELLGGLYTGINTKHITIASRMVADLTGMVVQPHKAIVGANAFAHESGIHQDGMLKHKGTYEIIAPEEIGLLRADEAGLVLGKLSGRHALKSRLQQLGYELDGKNLDEVFKRFKALADKKKAVHDDDLEALLSDEIHQPTVIWSLTDLQVVCGTMGLSTATVKLVGPHGVEHVGTSVGTGPVDASYKAVDRIVKEQVTLLEYSMNAVTEGIDAIAHTRVVIRGENPHSATHPQTGKLVQRSCSGTGAGEDVVVSSVRAYVSALNKLLGFRASRTPKPSVRTEEPQVAA